MGNESRFWRNQIIFREGDPGGDLFFVKKGEVEVYRTYKDREISLSIVKEGEVLGVLSLQGKQPRSASAKAMNDVTVALVDHSQFEDVLSKCQPWMSKLIRDLTKTLFQMNETYMEAIYSRNKMERYHKTILDKAGRFAEALGVTGSVLTVSYRGKKIVYLEPLIKHVEEVMGLKKKLSKMFFRCLVKAGLIQTFVCKKNQQFVLLPQLRNLKVLKKVVKNYQLLNPGSKIRFDFSSDELRLISHVCEHMMASGQKLCLDRDDLISIYRAVHDKELDQTILARLEKFKLIRDQGDEFEFAAQMVLQGSRCITALKRLSHEQYEGSLHTHVYEL